MLKAFGAWKQDYWAFLDRYTHWYDGPFGVQIKKGKNQPELKETLAPFMLRRKKEDVLPQLPKITFETVVVEPGLINEEIWFPNSVGQKDKELPRKLDEQRKVLEVLDLDEVVDALHRLSTFMRGSSTSRSPSPSRLRPSTVIAIAMPGNSVIQAASRM